MAASADLESEHITTSLVSCDLIDLRACNIACSSAENMEVREGSRKTLWTGPQKADATPISLLDPSV